jgi:hypothetical protein
MKKLFYILLTPWRKFKERRAHNKRLKELREQDPFIYK